MHTQAESAGVLNFSFFILARVCTPFSPIRERERDKDREREREREMYNMVIFIFKRNGGYLGTY